MTEWASFADVLPHDGAMVIVRTPTWPKPKILQFFEKFSPMDGPAVVDGCAGRWYWYPDRMRWKLVPDDYRPVKTLHEENP